MIGKQRDLFQFKITCTFAEYLSCLSASANFMHMSLYLSPPSKSSSSVHSFTSAAHSSSLSLLMGLFRLKDLPAEAAPEVEEWLWFL